MLPNYRFGHIEVRLSERALIIDGKHATLGARAFEVLHALIENRDRVVTKDELLDLAWPGLVVEENNLQVQISTLRKLLGQHAVATIAGRGYQFALAEVTTTDSPSAKLSENTAATAGPNNVVNTPAVPVHNRHDEVAEIRRLLGQSRMVTVKGTSGIGKASLSIQTGYDLLAVTPDGVWFVDLDTVQDPLHVAASVMNAVAQTTSPVETALHDLVNYLGSKEALLIIDNCEQVIDSVGSVCSALLHACPNVRVLCTSQDRLNIVGEHVYRPPTLTDPNAIALYVTRKGQSLPPSG